MKAYALNQLVLCIPKIARTEWSIEHACSIKDEFAKEFGNCVASVSVCRSEKWSNCAKVFVVMRCTTERTKDLKNYIEAGNMLLMPDTMWHCYKARPVPYLTSEVYLVQADFTPPLLARQNAVCKGSR
jgi:hypothetical protein